MSTPITFNGVSYSVPAYNDTGYAQGPGNLSSYLIAIASGTLQQTGGTFSLTADVNFGLNFGLVTKYVTSTTVNPATAGTLRLAKTDVIDWRNNANSGNNILSVNSSDALQYNGATVLTGSGGGFVSSITGTANEIIASSSTGAVTLSTPQPIASSSSPTFVTETLSGLSVSSPVQTDGSKTLISANINLASQVTGNLSVTNLNSGTAASGSTFWRGDGTWAAPSGSGTVNSGTAGTVALYNTSTNAVGTFYVQNAHNIALGIVSQASRSVDLTYNFPNPGNAVGSTNVILSDSLAGSQTINSNITMASTIAMGANKITGLANGTASTDAAAFGQIPVITAPTVQRLTSASGTYTRPTSPTPLYLRIKIVGGGGGGGGSGTASGSDGSAGTASTFSTLSAGGGGGGTHDGGSGGTGGSNSTAGITVLNIQGGSGQGSDSDVGAISAQLSGGIGGATPWGGGARSAFLIAGAAGQNGTGEGGQGGGFSTGTTNNTGAGGGAGGYLEAIFTSPSSTYSYTVGPGGNGGSAGTSGNAGGAGGSGLIVVEEYYQ